MAEGGQQAQDTGIETFLQTGGELFDSDPRKALAAYYQAVTIDPAHMEGWNQIGRLLFDLQQYSEAEMVFARVEQLAGQQNLPDWAEMARQNVELTRQTREQMAAEQPAETDSPEAGATGEAGRRELEAPEKTDVPEDKQVTAGKSADSAASTITEEARSIRDISNIAEVTSPAQNTAAPVEPAQMSGADMANASNVSNESNMAGEISEASPAMAEVPPPAISSSSVSPEMTRQQQGEALPPGRENISADKPVNNSPPPSPAASLQNPARQASLQPGMADVAAEPAAGQNIPVEQIPVASAPVEVAILETLTHQAIPHQEAGPQEGANRQSSSSSPMAPPVSQQPGRFVPPQPGGDQQSTAQPPVGQQVPAAPPIPGLQPASGEAQSLAKAPGIAPIPVPPTSHDEAKSSGSRSGKVALMITGIVGAVGIGIGAAQYLNMKPSSKETVPVVKSEAKLASKTAPRAAKDEMPVSVEVVEEPKPATTGRDQAYKIGMTHLLKGDFDKARAYLERAEAEGHAEAGYNLASLYAKGEGVEQDFEKAAKYLTRSSERGYYPAMTNLGLLYAQGQGVAQDYGKARELWLKAAAGEHADAMHNLAVIYATGKGVDKDMSEAIKWYRKGANAGYVDSIANLGLIYANGDGVERDYEEARRLWEQAAAKGHAVAAENLEKLKKIMAAGKTQKQQ